ncbi:zinc ribbon domain-containing protein [Candidatus Woesearchaeota archaeon]|jgi:hypothetical protein|nr:zinc ribbon domain-containing protein [Candidatus Woesearchaeota archaeon]
MGSENLFIKCKTCGKEASKVAKSCPHCGEKIKKLSVIRWIGIVLFSLFVIGLINAPNKNEQSNSSETVANVSEKTKAQPEVAMPADEIQFISTVEKYVSGFREAKNELQQSALRDQRKIEIAKIIGGRTVSSWVGKINKLETNTEGKAILSIQISPDIEIKTWNNALSDINANTLISKDSSLYSSLFELSRGQQVEFSGNFFSSTTDYIEETSMTIQGSMRSPEFLFKFKSVKHLN